MDRHFVFILTVVVIFSLRSQACIGADPLGTVEKDFNFHAYDLLADPNLPYVYATTDNGLEIINTNTLTATNLSLVGSARGMSLSLDGNYLYIAGGNTSVVDTHSQTVVNTLPGGATSIAAGLDNRLYLLIGTFPNAIIYQMDVTTGLSAGPNVPTGNTTIYSGELQISPDRKTLYYGNYGLSPAGFSKIDVTTTTPAVLWQNNFSDYGSNGEDLVISHDGSMIAYVTGSGYQDGYKIPNTRTQDMTVQGIFATGAYPNAIAYSPDDKIAFALHSPYPTAVDVYDTTTSTLLGQFAAVDRGSKMVVDQSGQNLFVSYDDSFFHNTDLVVYSTGEFVPEPSTAILLIAGSALLLASRCVRNRPINSSIFQLS